MIKASTTGADGKIHCWEYRFVSLDYVLKDGEESVPELFASLISHAFPAGADDGPSNVSPRCIRKMVR